MLPPQSQGLGEGISIGSFGQGGGAEGISYQMFQGSGCYSGPGHLLLIYCCILLVVGAVDRHCVV